MQQIIVHNLGKKYRRYASQWHRLAEILSWGRYQNHEIHWALKDINFEINKGEAIGIIGENGAGKSTLLKLLVGTTQPNEGSVQTSGRVAALLELGMGFHPDFTGRENAAMSCRMAGLSNAEIKAAMPQIKHFSELGDFLDQPLRVYSTGMQMRLAFSAATVIRPEILIVDEALAVGDAYFQHKCIQRIRSFQQEGTTLLFVSHDPGAVKTLCRRGLLFDKGMLITDSQADAVLDYYNAMIAKKNEDEEIQQIETQSSRVMTRSGSGEASILKVEMLNEKNQPTRGFQVGEPTKIVCQIGVNTYIERLNAGILIRDRLGNNIFGTNTSHLKKDATAVEAGDTLAVEFTLPLNLGRGSYSLSAAVHPGATHLEGNFDWWDQCLVFQIISHSSANFTGVVSLPVDIKLIKESSDDRNAESRD
jgi:lipopolysaccharide transport system ATP-binding protein